MFNMFVCLVVCLFCCLFIYLFISSFVGKIHQLMFFLGGQE